MRWTKVNDQWECVFVNVPLKVLLVDKVEFIKATLYFNDHDFWIREIATKTYASVELAKAEVEAFILEHLALYSAQVHRECLEADTMTWRKLKEQLYEIPEDQLDHPVRVLDADWDWCGTPSIMKAEKDRYSLEENGHDTEYTEEVQCLPEVEEGHYYLDIEL